MHFPKVFLSFCFLGVILGGASKAENHRPGSGNASGENVGAETEPQALPSFAFIDLGKDHSPVKITNSGLILLNNYGSSGPPSKVWRKGGLIDLKPSEEGHYALATDISEEGSIIGSEQTPDNSGFREYTDLAQWALPAEGITEVEATLGVGTLLENVGHGYQYPADPQSAYMNWRQELRYKAGACLGGGIVWTWQAAGRNWGYSLMDGYENGTQLGTFASTSLDPQHGTGTISGPLKIPYGANKAGQVLLQLLHVGGTFNTSQALYDTIALNPQYYLRTGSSEVQLPGVAMRLNNDGVVIGADWWWDGSQHMLAGASLGGINAMKKVNQQGQQAIAYQMIGSTAQGICLWQMDPDTQAFGTTIKLEDCLPKDSQWSVQFLSYINDQGLIVGWAKKIKDAEGNPIPLANQESHGALLVPVDIKIAKSQSNDTDYIPEEKEESEGAYVPLNADNDNGSPYKEVSGHSTHFPTKYDFDAVNLDRDDDELVHLRVDLPTNLGSNFSGKFEITESGRAKIKIWKDRKKTQPFDLNQWSTFQDFPKDLYVEGVKEGAEEREIELKLLVKVGTSIAEGDKIKVTVTPVLEKFFAKAARAQPIVRRLLDGNLLLLSGGDFNITVTSLYKNRNMPGEPATIQLARIASPTGNAAKLFEISDLENPVHTWGFDYKTPHQGKTLVDANSENNPAYGTNNTFPLQDGVRFEIYDNPQIQLEEVSGTITQSTDVDSAWFFEDYAVWRYSDGSYYTLGKTDWNVRWVLRFGRISNEPLGYVWGQLSPLFLNYTNPAFTRDNTPPEIVYPVAKDALNQGDGGWQ